MYLTRQSERKINLLLLGSIEEEGDDYDKAGEEPTG